MKAFTKKEISKIEELAIKKGLQTLQMMELAGFHMVHVFHKLRILKSSKILVVAGVGNNGGDALCAARHLSNFGYRVEIVLAKTGLKKEAFHQLHIIQKMKLSISVWNKKFKFSNYDVIIDGLLGYNIEGNPKNPFCEIINAINESKAKVISYDIPSGLDATLGKVYDPVVFADATLALHAPKVGLLTREGKKISGKIFIGNIGVPEIFYKKRL